MTQNLEDAQYEARVLIEELDTARETYAQFLEAWGDVARGLERLDTFAGRQIAAYQPFTRDQGMGDRPDAWFDRAEAALKDILETI